MTSTSVHFPKGLLEELDFAASETGTSRNGLIVASCRAHLRKRRRAWPEGFFLSDHLTEDGKQELRDGAEDFAARIDASRRSRSESPL